MFDRDPESRRDEGERVPKTPNASDVEMAIGHKTFRLELITPDRSLAALDDCTFAALPAWDGQVGVLANRAPMVCKLGSGELRLETPAGWQRYTIRGGFAEVLNNRVTVLTERASLV